MTNKGVKRPYISFLGNAATEVTGSMWLIRFKKYSILLDCGLIQGHDIATDYRMNREQLKKIKPKEIDWIILEEAHADHSCLIPALYAKGCQAHIIAPSGTKDIVELLWRDSLKIMQQDAIKLQRKHGIKACAPYDEPDIEKALCRIIDVDDSILLSNDINVTFYEANHIVHSKQVLLEMKDGYKTTRIGFTGDIGGDEPQHYLSKRETLPFVDVLISENTYNSPARNNRAKDREKDREKITTVVNQYNKVLFPVFSLGRTQTMLTELYNLWLENKIDKDIRIVVDSPLAVKICNIYPNVQGWYDVLHWNNVRYITEYADTLSAQEDTGKMVILSSSGFMTGGKVRSWLKCLLPNRDACICYCGYSGDIGIAHDIKNGIKSIDIDGDVVANKCNIIDLVSYSSHANYDELMHYLVDECRYNKVALVHGNYDTKVGFCQELQNRLVEQGKSSRVVCVQQDTKITL